MAKEASPSIQALASSEGTLVSFDTAATFHDEVGEARIYMKGWRLHLVTAALCLAVFLPSFEVSIIATSLVSITDALLGFDQSSWLITAYLLTYTGFLIVWGKLSDIFGRKLLIITTLGFFVVFSGACGAAQSMTQLIVFRAMQGIGGAGTYALAMIMLYDLVPPEKYAAYVSAVSGVLGVALVLGPVLAGLINNYTTWRWVFLLNCPAGAASMFVLLLAVPTNFPYHGLPEMSYKTHTLRQSFSRSQLRRVDFLGTALLLVATTLLVAALEEAGGQYDWNSAFVIACLTISGLSWVAFLAWSWKITRAEGDMEPIFPWRFLQSRVRMGMLMSMFFTGGPFTVAVIGIPLRFQAVNSLSALDAGVRLLPFAGLTLVGTVLAGAVAGKAKIPPIYLMLGGSAIQVVSFALLSTLPTTTSVTNAEYGYEAVYGFGVGVSLACLFVMMPFTVEVRDKAVATSALLQFRMLGGTVAFAIATSVINSYIKTHLAPILSPAQIKHLLQTTEAFQTLSPALADTVKTVFAEGYNLQMRIMIGFSAAQIPATLAMWQKKQIIV